MNAETQQIVRAYEKAGMTPEEIHESFCPDIEVATIKATLMQFSPKWKQDCGFPSPSSSTEAQSPSQEGDVTAQEFEEIKRAYKSLALNSENEEIKARACKWLWQEFKGRNEKKVLQAPSVNFNIAVFNDHLKQARQVLQDQKAQKQIAALVTEQSPSVMGEGETIEV